MKWAKKNLVLLIFFGIVILGGWFLLSKSSRKTAHAPARLRFISLAWQEQAITTNKRIVAEWNEIHPSMAVEYVQSSWNAIHDYLITSFETDEVPDIFHYESATIVDFANRGFLADLRPYLEEELRQDILDVAWASVTRPDGAVCGIPFVMESFIVLYNKAIFDNNDIAMPTFEQPWTWQDMRRVAQQLTQDTDGDGAIDQWGVAMGLRSAANIIMNHSISFGGAYFTREDGHYMVRVGAAEKQMLQLIMDMLYVDNTMAPSSIGKTGAGMIPEFIGGKYAMLVGIGSWARQQLVENAPTSFQWGVIPPLKAESQNIGINTQTLSIPVKSKRQREAMAFIKFMLNTENMAQLAASDWMIPTRKSCLEMDQFRTTADGWQIVNASVKYLSSGVWLGVPGYVEWKTRVMNPILQELFANRYSIEQAAAHIEAESNLVLSRYQRREAQK